jgi:serine/threonine-protein kinase
VAEQIDIRLGQLARQAGFITEIELAELLRQQERRAKQGAPIKVGDLMVELGYVTQRQVQRLLGAQAVVSAKVSRIGPYHLIAKLGEGGMGAVYHAQDIRTSEQVALKVLPRSKAADPEFLARFESEARAVFELDHPNIVRAVGLGEADGYHYLAMEYVEGKDVYDLLEARGRISEHEALTIVIQITRALEHAFEERMVHRDIKPGNILVDRNGLAKLTDFGLALDREREGRSRITETNEALGTPFYLSPEQARGSKDIDVRSDFYSLGATLYEMVTGHPPFDGSPAEVMAKHLNEQIPSPRDIDRTLSHGLCRVIQKMMAKKREDRYQTPRDLLKDLMLVYGGEDPVGAQLPSDRSSVRASSRPGQRRPASKPPHASDHRRRPRGIPLGDGPIEAAHRTPVPRGAERRLGRALDWVESHAHLVASVSLGVATLAVLLAILVSVSARSGRRPDVPQPPSAEGIRLISGFENGTPEGWTGSVVSKSAGEGKYSLVVPAASSPNRGLSTTMQSLTFVAGRRIEIAFLYYADSAEPIIVELSDRQSSARICHVVAHPMVNAWTAARVIADQFTFAPEGTPRGFAGRLVHRLTIRAPEAPPDGLLALDAIWLWSGQ